MAKQTETAEPAPDPSYLIDALGIDPPVIGVYEGGDSEAYDPVVLPSTTAHTCVFVFYRRWIAGKTVCLEPDRSGCIGCGYWMLGQQRYSRESFANFLVACEGLKADTSLMDAWLDDTPPHAPTEEAIMVGPLNPSQYAHLKTVTFFVNPDQLSALVFAAQTHSTPEDPLPTIAPFGSGCGQLLALFKDLTVPQAIVGATDITMRPYLPAGVLGFTVTKPMFEHLCALGEDSFLNKPIWENLKKAREQKEALSPFDGDK